MVDTVSIPTALVYGFREPRVLRGLFPLFGRVGLNIDEFPNDPGYDPTNKRGFRDTLHNCKAMRDIVEVQPGGTKHRVAFVTGDWRILSVKVSLTRFWACSTASITLACPLLDTTAPLPLAPVHPEQALAVAMGYDDTLYGLLGPNAKLNRVFTGYIDTISYKEAPKRVLCTITLRDAMRFLVNTKITRLYRGVDATASAREGGTIISGARDEIIRGIILDGTGSYGETDVTGVPIEANDRVFQEDQLHLDKSGRSDIDQVAFTPQGNAGTKGTNIVTADKQFYNVMNRFPIEVVKHLSSLEPQPMEFYADAYGDLHWHARGMDLTNQKPRDYWFRQAVQVDSAETRGVYPILGGSMEWSTLGTMTEFVVVNPVAQQGSMLAIRGRVKPTSIFGFPMASRTRFIFDDTLVDKPDINLKQEATDFLLGMLMLWGKDIRGGSIEVVGDASLSPGDPIRVWNMGLYPPPENLFRIESVIHQLTATGPRRGFRSSVLFAEPEYKPAINTEWLSGTAFDLLGQGAADPRGAPKSKTIQGPSPLPAD